MKFKIKTSVPRGRSTWEPDTAAKVQASLFATVAMLAAGSKEAEAALYNAINAAKLACPAAPA